MKRCDWWGWDIGVLDAVLGGFCTVGLAWDAWYNLGPLAGVFVGFGIGGVATWSGLYKYSHIPQ